MAFDIFAITILLKHDLKSIFNKTLLVLAIFDAAFNACDILETIRSTYYDNYSCLPMPFYQKMHLYLTPQFLRPLRIFLVITSMYTTVVIALERYLAVSKPIMAFVERDEKTWKKVICMLGPVIFVSFLLAVPLCFEFFDLYHFFLLLIINHHMQHNQGQLLYQQYHL